MSHQLKSWHSLGSSSNNLLLHFVQKLHNVEPDLHLYNEPKLFDSWGRAVSLLTLQTDGCLDRQTGMWTVWTTDGAGTWHHFPRSPHRHLMTESSSDKDRPTVVQSPEQTVIGTGLNTDQLHSHWLWRQMNNTDGTIQWDLSYHLSCLWQLVVIC